MDVVQQLRTLLSQLERQNPESFEKFVSLLSDKRVAQPMPATASKLSALLYKRWLEGLRGRWNVLDEA